MARVRGSQLWKWASKLWKAWAVVQSWILPPKAATPPEAGCGALECLSRRPKMDTVLQSRNLTYNRRAALETLRRAHAFLHLCETSQLGKRVTKLWDAWAVVQSWILSSHATTPLEQHSLWHVCEALSFGSGLVSFGRHGLSSKSGYCRSKLETVVQRYNHP